MLLTTIYERFLVNVRKYVAELGRLNAETSELLSTLKEHERIRINLTRSIMETVDRLKSTRREAESHRDAAFEDIIGNAMPIIILDDEEDRSEKKKKN